MFSTHSTETHLQAKGKKRKMDWDTDCHPTEKWDYGLDCKVQNCKTGRLYMIDINELGFSDWFLEKHLLYERNAMLYFISFSVKVCQEREKIATAYFPWEEILAKNVTDKPWCKEFLKLNDKKWIIELINVLNR